MVLSKVPFKRKVEQKPQRDQTVRARCSWGCVLFPSQIRSAGRIVNTGPTFFRADDTSIRSRRFQLILYPFCNPNPPPHDTPKHPVILVSPPSLSRCRLVLHSFRLSTPPPPPDFRTATPASLTHHSLSVLARTPLPNPPPVPTQCRGAERPFTRAIAYAR